MQPNHDTDGTQFTYDRDGTGQPLCLLHGGMAPPEYWTPVRPELENYATIVPQRPGFGTCLDDPAETGPEDVLDREVRYVRELVDTVDGEPILFGHSYGALAAIEAARAATVDAVVAYEPAILPEPFRTEADLAAQMERLLEDGRRREAIQRYVELVLHPDGIDDLDAWLAEWPVWPDCVDLAEEVTRMNRAVERYRLPDRLDVDAPVLVLTGTAGPDFLRESARSVHDALPNSRFVEFDGLGHGGPARSPRRVVDVVESFLDDRVS
ncbi:alpha/beta fold hydrolase [Halovivax limisalsi]|uniref:alpha/beta fold hydrolase n=1 Tax=Halovivax limisalsi TaxID=1453760 RepID=UPI001FFD734D|nr:alpha/beta hydrolase [Halovivax limisalsi]